MNDYRTGRGAGMDDEEFCEFIRVVLENAHSDGLVAERHTCSDGEVTAFLAGGSLGAEREATIEKYLGHRIPE